LFGESLMRRPFRLGLSIILAGSMAIDPVSAGHWLRGGGRGCQPAYSQYSSGYSYGGGCGPCYGGGYSNYDPCYSYGGYGGGSYVGGGCGGESYMGGGYVDGGAIVS